MNVLIIDVEMLGLDFALRCAAAGHNVRWYRWSKKPAKDGTGFKQITIIDDWRSSMVWAKSGLIFLTGNCRFLNELERFRDFGFPIFGPSLASATLEINRGEGMKAMKSAGIEVPNYREFNSLEEAEKFARKSDQTFVFKPMGDEDDKSLTYVSSDPADLVGWLQRNIKAGKKLKGRCMLQERIDMLAELGVSGWFGSDGFLENKWQLCFEHKKLMPGDIGPSCFTPDAEVLTKSGWKFWPEVTLNDEICTLKDGEIEFELPSQVVVGDFDGNLIGWKNNKVDILVTPGHNMYVQDDHYRKPFFFESASETFQHRRTIMRAGGEWIGTPPILQKEKEYAALVGAYIADGNCKKRSVVFGNCPEHKIEIFSKIARDAGYSANIYGKDLYINSISLVKSLAPLGLSHEKFVPLHIKKSSKEVIEYFLKGYGAGDGTTRPNNLTYTTVSPRLANDLQELCLKIGWAASITVKDRRGESHFIKGYECINKRVSYEVSVATKQTKAELSSDNSYLEPYKGKVYCVTVSSHVIYTRRNGRACWIGQTGEQGTTCQYNSKDKLADEFLKPMESMLKKLGHRGDFAIGCGIDKKGKAWPFEFTARAGWPAFYIQVASHLGDPVQWMKDALMGKDTLKVSNDVAIGVVCAQPNYPYNKSPPELVEGNPIAGEFDENIHPAAVMMAKGPVMRDGKLVEEMIHQTTAEYVLVATGLGKTVKDAQESVYSTIDGIKFKDMMYRNDIGDKQGKCLPELHKFGYCEDMDFGK